MVNQGELATFVSWPTDTSDSVFLSTTNETVEYPDSDRPQQTANRLSSSSDLGATKPTTSSLSSSLRPDSSPMGQSASNGECAVAIDTTATGSSATSRDRVGADRDGLAAQLSFDDVQTSRAVSFFSGQADGRTHCALNCWQLGNVEQWRHVADCSLAPRRVQGHQTADMAAIRFTYGDPKSPVSPAASMSFFPPAGEFVNHRATGNTQRQTRSANSVEQPTTKITNTLDGEKQLLADENSRLQDAKTCRVCTDKEVNSVFIPCGHLVSCDQCSRKVRSCSICTADIHGVVNSKHFSHRLDELLTSVMIS